MEGESKRVFKSSFSGGNHRLYCGGNHKMLKAGCVEGDIGKHEQT